MSQRKCQMAYLEEREISAKDFFGSPLETEAKGSPRLLVGRREWLMLPEIGVMAVHAKVDTGARSSSLHAENIETFEKNGELWVSFLTHERHGRSIVCETPVKQKKMVRSSNGIAQERVFIETLARSSEGIQWVMTLSLSDRRVMKCPLLLGRETLSGRFVVDTQRTNLLGSIAQLENPR